MNGAGETPNSLKSQIIIEEINMSGQRISPVHPGAYLKEILEEFGLSQQRIAEDLGLKPVRISHIINSRRPITPEIALRLGRYFGQNPRYWLNLQSRYDMDTAYDTLYEQIVREVHPMTEAADIPLLDI